MPCAHQAALAPPSHPRVSSPGLPNLQSPRFCLCGRKRWLGALLGSRTGERWGTGRVPGEKGTRWLSPSRSSCGESNNKSEVNPHPGRKLSLKLDEATAVQRESDTQTREQLLIPHRKMGMESSGPGGRPPLCFTGIENTALLRGWDLETQTPRGSCQVEGSPRLPAFASLVRGLAVMRRGARTFNWLGQKGFLIRQTGGGGGI